MTESGKCTSDTYRVFCAYDHRGRAPGCGWQRVVDDENEAERLAEQHSGTHVADYERYVDTGTEQEGESDE